MGRTWLCSFAGAGVGFLVGFAGVWMLTSAQPPGDRSGIAFFVGVFLAGCGAIAGAVGGGAADLLKFFKSREQARTEAHARRGPESEV